VLKERSEEKLAGDEIVGKISNQDTSKTRERCRQAGRRLASRGEVVVTQNGKVVDPGFAKGVMELKLPS